MKADIIIFGGQSNMQGETECLSENEAVENALEYKFCRNVFEPLKNPVGEAITILYKEEEQPKERLATKELRMEWRENHVTGAAAYQHTNMVPSFCRAYIKETGRNVIAVHVAKGDTVIAQWLPGTPGYRIIKDKSLAAIEKTKQEYEIGHIRFVWLQGESDAIYSSGKEFYKVAITSLKNALMRDIGIEKFGIIRVGRFVNDERDDEIINAQEEVCAEDKDFVMLTRIATELNQIPEYMNPQARGHFSAKGQEKLGNVAGTALGKLSE